MNYGQPYQLPGQPQQDAVSQEQINQAFVKVCGRVVQSELDTSRRVTAGDVALLHALATSVLCINSLKAERAAQAAPTQTPAVVD